MNSEIQLDLSSENDFILRTFKFYELRIFNISYEIEYRKGPLFLHQIILNLYKEFLLTEDNLQILKQLSFSGIHQKEVSFLISFQSYLFDSNLKAFEKIFRTFLI